jgi:hypothetical protein
LKQRTRKKNNAVYTGNFSFLRGKEKCVTLKAEHGVCTAGSEVWQQMMLVMV